MAESVDAGYFSFHFVVCGSGSAASLSCSFNEISILSNIFLLSPLRPLDSFSISAMVDLRLLIISGSIFPGFSHVGWLAALSFWYAWLNSFDSQYCFIYAQTSLAA